MKNNESNENRRKFLKKIGGATASTLAIGAFAGISTTEIAAQVRSSKNAPVKNLVNPRADAALQVRVGAARSQYNLPGVLHPSNGDEERYSNFIGNFSKALPHNNLGEVNEAAYQALLAATASGNVADYDAIPMGGTQKLANPQAATSFHLEGADCDRLTMPAAPSIESTMTNAEILEVYWQSIVRDISFNEYPQTPLIETAVRELRRFPVFRNVTSKNIFRGNTNGDFVGNYVSQFLLHPIPFGATTVEQRYRVPLAGEDKMTDFSEWLNIQNGLAPSTSINFDPTPRYIRNGRDLGEYVHLDFSYQPYMNAALIMLGWGRNALSDTNPYKTNLNQAGFVQFGGPHILDMVSRAAIASLKSAWYQKWNVHRRLRPEAFAGLLHKQATGMADYGLNIQIGGSRALASIFSRTGTYLLPMAYPEGSPVHPAYPAGHATLAGACTTILKAFFNENFEVRNPVEVSNDGLSLNNYTGYPLTIGNELNKLAANISLGRDMSGVHWRSDGIEGIRLGEAVAISILRDYKQTYNENFDGFSFTKFSGENITI